MKPIWEGSETARYQQISDPFVANRLECLNTRQRKVIELVFWEGMNMREVAAAMGISLTWAYRLREAALAKLADRFRAHRLRRLMSL
jgi:DNA-directed RNA polymerase specialized sigma subunit